MIRYSPIAATTPLTPPQFSASHWAQIVKALRLSPRQANIVSLIMQARRDKQIAAALGVSPNTVHTHLRAPRRPGPRRIGDPRLRHCEGVARASFPHQN